MNSLIIRIFLIAILSVFIHCNPSDKGVQKPQIAINQLGYFPEGEKMAVVNFETDKFCIKSQSDDEIVFEGELSEKKFWDLSGEWLKLADFSDFKRGGKYYVTAGDVNSYPFEISEDIYDGLFDAAFHTFYLARASTDLPEAYAGAYHRKGGHPDDSVKVYKLAASAERPEGTVISAPKGWYDAGDYNKYIVNSGITTYSLMALYESIPAFMQETAFNIPEKNNTVPDILDEVKWNLDWMFAMQDPHDGGVYHKLTSLKFAGFVMPAQAKSQRYVVQKSTAAALNFTAVFAQASRIFKNFDHEFPGLSGQYLAAARRSWKWAREHPRDYYEQAEEIQTGKYTDHDLSDEFAWAATELFITTGDESYYRKYNLAGLKVETQFWDSVGALGYISLIHNRKNLPDFKDMKKIERRFLAYADTLCLQKEQMPYRIPEIAFKWGVHAVLVNNAMSLIVAYNLSGKDKYLDGALSCMDFILGRNPLNHSFVTGFGDHTSMNIHHRPSGADTVAAPFPGMLVGGPNMKETKYDLGWEAYPSKLPAFMYLDVQGSWATNEVAINWNAPLTFVTGSLKYITGQKPASKNDSFD